MHLDARSGPATIVAALDLTSFHGHPVVFTLPPEHGGLVIAFTFGATDDGAFDVVPHAREDGWTFELRNVVDASGRGSADPVLLGTLDDDLLFLHFRAFRYGRTDDTTLHLTCYRVPADAVGWQPHDPAPEDP